MQVNTEDLEGDALNWAVRFAELGREPKDYVPARDNFSTCWNKGGPIIDREDMTVGRCWNGGRPETGKAACKAQIPFVNGKANYDAWAYGPTKLVAAMRCHVVNRLGPVIEVPDGLMMAKPSSAFKP